MFKNILTTCILFVLSYFAMSLLAWSLDVTTWHWPIFVLWAIVGIPTLILTIVFNGIERDQSLVIEQMSDKLEFLEDQQECSDDLIYTLRDKNSSLLNQLNATEKRVENLRNRVDERDKTISKLQNENATLLKDNEDLGIEVSKFVQLVFDLTKELRNEKDFREIFAEYSRLHGGHSDRIVAMISDLEEYRKRFGDLNYAVAS